ncbi:MAG: UDP-N-acetylglucosamine 1-carboxyvinyltransferase, partial [Lachnospiraceae bacterium]|nr:UDP-N-acetylglucosamine 1-carboxyvinyltransferase [Lachnospiraceae bacterium]
NVMLAAVLAPGRTVMYSAAKEPHVVDVANLLNRMGARILGAGTDKIIIRGVEKLHGCTYPIVPDQIEAGTFMMAAAATRGDIVLRNVIPRHLEVISEKLRETGCEIENYYDAVRVKAPDQLKYTNVKTSPYPGFPTDMQPQIAVVLTMARGSSIISESIFENRFAYVEQLIAMGADINVNDKGDEAYITGVERLKGCKVQAPDLRAGAALVIAGLSAEGYTFVDDIKYILRGYEDFEIKLQKLGAQIVRTESDKDVEAFMELTRNKTLSFDLDLKKRMNL